MIHDERLLPGSAWRHVKTGHVYRLIDLGKTEATCEDVAIYRIDPAAAGVKSEASLSIWVRPVTEFLDRFRWVGP